MGTRSNNKSATTSESSGSLGAVVVDRRERRSLTHVGGEVYCWGEPAGCELLAHALEVPSSVSDELAGEDLARAHVHGFHAYPARMHPRTAAELIAGLTQAGDTVLDPFCGSGTVLVEAALAGRRARGTDLNPLACAIAERKTTPTSASERQELLEAAKRVALVARTRREKRAGASRRFPPEDVELFDPHVLLELDGLRVGIEAEPRALARDLSLVLSAILVKFSRKRSDTRAELRAPRIAAGYPSKFFVKKSEELCRALAEVEAPLRAAPKALIKVADARSLAGMSPDSVHLVLTSPPYAGVYDYFEHHRMRLRWLGLAERGLEQHEIGARRTLSRLSAREAEQTYASEIEAALQAQLRVLRAGGRAVWLVADSGFRSEALRADEVVCDAAMRAGMVVLAIASQDRPHFHRPGQAAFERQPRREHAILLGKKT